MYIHCFWNPWYIDDGYIATGISWSNLDDRFYSLPLGKIQFGVLRRLSFPNGKTIKNKNSAINNNKKNPRDTEGHNSETNGLSHTRFWSLKKNKQTA